jgi:hypothetical protein
MASKKISQLTAATTPLIGTEELAIVQGSQTVKATAQDVANLSPILPVVNTYPTTTPASAGTRFLYKGNEWHYMTAAEIASAGWTGLVSVGFPAPVVKAFNADIATDFTGLSNGSTNGQYISTGTPNFTIIDFLGFGNPTRLRSMFLSNGGATEIKNANLLTNLRNEGTTIAVGITNNSLSATAINDFFTALPVTSATCTIQVTGNPGAATCNPGIATAKGYTVTV